MLLSHFSWLSISHLRRNLKNIHFNRTVDSIQNNYIFPTFDSKPKSQHWFLCKTSHTRVLSFVQPITQQLDTYPLADPSISTSFSCPQLCQYPEWIDRTQKKRQIPNTQTRSHAEKVFHYFQKNCQGFSQGALDPCFISLLISLVFLVLLQK